MSERFMSRRSARTRASIGTPGPTLALRGIVLLSAGLGLVACPGPSADGGGTGGAPPVGSGGAPLGSGGAPATGGLSSGGTESGGAGGASSGGGGGLTSGGTTGAGGGSGGDANLAPANLSETGLYTERTATGELVLAEGVREFEPKYWLWSDGSDKKRYIYLPPGTQIDTTDPDHWVFPLGTKFWKSFISGGQLVETRLIERTDENATGFRFATYFWMSADATDAIRMDYKNLLLNAAGTTHDIPNGQMCERCHNPIQERIAGFGALQLNHDKGGVTLQTLLDENLLTVPISTDIDFPGSDQATKDVLGYLHANCGNCHNDSPGLPLESVPAPQMLLRGKIGHQSLEDTDVYATAINQASTASAELGIDFRIKGGSVPDSAVHFRMTRRMIEDQMPPIGTEVTDPDALELLSTWITNLPPPTP